MANERTEVALSDLKRWLAVAGIILAGVALYFWLAPRTHPIVETVSPEASQ
jgi:hypothetical protein